MSDSLGTILLLGMVASVVISVGVIVVVAVLLVRLPADYFCDPPPRDFWADTHPVIRRTGRFLKNVLGAVLVLVGVVLSLPGIPGPGIVTVLVGVMLLDFPQKRRLEIWLIRRPLVLRTVNHWRARCGRLPFAWRRSTDVR